MTRSGPGLVLLHALPFDGGMWAGQMSILPEQTYAPNLYEFGDDIQIWAEQCLEQIKQDKFIIVGCSVGGSCAIEIARLVPERVTALVLIGTKARRDPDPNFFQDTLIMLETKNIDTMWQTYWRDLFDGVSDEEDVQFAERLALRQNQNLLRNGLTAFHTRPSREQVLCDWKFPIHIVTGEHDKLPGIQYSQNLAHNAKNATLHIVKSAGHYLPMTHVAEINAIIENCITNASIDDFLPPD